MQQIDQIRERLTRVLDPELGASIVELGMVGEIRIENATAFVNVALTTSGCPLRSQIERDVKEAALCIDGINKCAIHKTNSIFVVLSEIISFIHCMNKWCKH